MKLFTRQNEVSLVKLVRREHSVNYKVDPQEQRAHELIQKRRKGIAIYHVISMMNITVNLSSVSVN